SVELLSRVSALGAIRGAGSGLGAGAFGTSSFGAPGKAVSGTVATRVSIAGGAGDGDGTRSGVASSTGGGEDSTTIETGNGTGVGAGLPHRHMPATASIEAAMTAATPHAYRRTPRRGGSAGGNGTTDCTGPPRGGGPANVEIARVRATNSAAA